MSKIEELDNLWLWEWTIRRTLEWEAEDATFTDDEEALAFGYYLYTVTIPGIRSKDTIVATSKTSLEEAIGIAIDALNKKGSEGNRDE